MKKIILLSLLALLVSCGNSLQDAGHADGATSQFNTTENIQEDDETVTITFDTKTIQGIPVNSEIFADHKLTLINIWATWCGPCVNEMPYLQEVYQKLPEQINLITLCQDGLTKTDLAEEILANSNATFQTILPNEQLEQELLSVIRAFPTTLFVNNQGEVIGIIEGAPPTDVTETYLSLIYEVFISLEDINA